MLYKRVIVPTLTYNIETASNFRESDFKRLEKMQGKCLRRICKMPESTPYWGILIELGVVQIEYEVHQKRLMLYHNIVNSSDERIIKQIVYPNNVNIRDNMVFTMKYGKAQRL